MTKKEYLKLYQETRSLYFLPSLKGTSEYSKSLKARFNKRYEALVEARANLYPDVKGPLCLESYKPDYIR